jgi:hypothetical protein
MTQIINHQSNYQKLTAIVKTLIDNNPLYQENIDVSTITKGIGESNF